MDDLRQVRAGVLDRSDDAGVVQAPAPRGENEPAYLWGTFMAIPKDRMDGTLSTYVAAIPFDVRKGAYEEDYMLGRIVDNEWKALTQEQKPRWANRSVTL